VAVEVSDRLVDALSPVVQASGLELVDVVVGGSQVQVTVDRPGGVDLDELARANQELSRALDRLDPFPGAYTLEVSSPGLERRLRTPAHYVRAIGETVSVRTHPGDSPLRRVRGVLSAADETGCTIEGAEVPEGSIRLGYDSIERARTVFEWGSEPAAKGGKARRSGRRERSKS
jgi:ribosome maturation factor RimP